MCWTWTCLSRLECFPRLDMDRVDESVDISDISPFLRCWDYDRTSGRQTIEQQYFEVYQSRSFAFRKSS